MKKYSSYEGLIIDELISIDNVRQQFPECSVSNQWLSLRKDRNILDGGLSLNKFYLNKFQLYYLKG